MKETIKSIEFYYKNRETYDSWASIWTEDDPATLQEWIDDYETIEDCGASVAADYEKNLDEGERESLQTEWMMEVVLDNGETDKVYISRESIERYLNQ